MREKDSVCIETLLRSQRNKLHLTQTQVALAAGITLQSYQRLEYEMPNEGDCFVNTASTNNQKGDGIDSLCR